MSVKSYTQIIKDNETILTFGKHKGETVGDVLDADPQYLVWLCGNDIVLFPPDMIDEIYERANKELDDLYRDAGIDIYDFIDD